MTGDVMNRTKHASVVDQIWPGAQLKSSRRLSGGVSAEVYALEVMHPSGDVIHTVLREHSRSHAGFSAELEYNLLTALHRLGLPVPEALMFDESCDLVATPYLIMEFVGGSNVIPDEESFDYIDKMASQLVKIHQAPVKGLPDLPKRTDPRPEVFDYLPDEPESVITFTIIRSGTPERKGGKKRTEI